MRKKDEQMLTYLKKYDMINLSNRKKASANG
jgi:hypothetical protein